MLKGFESKRTVFWLYPCEVPAAYTFLIKRLFNEVDRLIKKFRRCGKFMGIGGQDSKRDLDFLFLIDLDCLSF